MMNCWTVLLLFVVSVYEVVGKIVPVNQIDLLILHIILGVFDCLVF